MRFTDTAQLQAHRRQLIIQPQPETRRLWVCGGPGCLAAGGRAVCEALGAEAARHGLAGQVAFRVDLSGCQGLCERGPLVEARPSGRMYQRVKPGDAPAIIADLRADPAGGDRPAESRLLPEPDFQAFFEPQTRLIMARLSRTDPEDFDDYLRTGGYEALALALDRMTPEEVCGRVADSGLRGRGGGGFPAGRKWRACRAAGGEVKYVLANGDEGDPGAFMNRSLMEGDPQAVIEGLILGAYAVGAARGFIYVRHEYPLSVARLNRALDSARERGLLGENILGRNFSFDIEVVEGGGAFVCGESTALMNSIEGREGLPRVKYVRSTERGLWERPTLLQNVETWANVPLIVKNGPAWFRSIGGRNNHGTKIFSLVGQVRRGGLVEMPLGVPLRTIVQEVGGGARPGRRLKAVQSGGPSGGCLPASRLDLPVDFDRLTEAGAMMGSGGLIVMDDLSCMVDVARYFTDFLAGESCGKCAPCREGLVLASRLLADLCQGRGRPGDTERLAGWAGRLSQTALCGLGQSAANPILSTIRYFSEEYREHEEEGYCRSGRCRGLYQPAINPDLCTGCGACRTACPTGAADGQPKKTHTIDQTRCLTCGACLSACRFGSVTAQRRPRTPAGAEGGAAHA